MPVPGCMDTRALALLGIGITLGLGMSHLDVSAPQSEGGAQKPLTVADFPDLVSGLKQTPGVLDVQTAVLGKKQTIFAWFKNRAAVQSWYASPMHREAMRKFFPNFPGRSYAAAEFKDDKSPILVVASVTPGDKPIMEGSPLHARQIAIEMYTPVPGGITIGGGFGPESLEVPGLARLPAKSGG